MALLNDSATDRIQADSNRSDSFSAFTFCAWVYLNTVQEGYISRYGGSDRTFAFTPTAPNDELQMGVARATQESNGTTTDFNATTATWYFVAGVYNEDNTVWGGAQAMEGHAHRRGDAAHDQYEPGGGGRDDRAC
jgi:hypothetical protein